jgi:hypothetical protein
MIRKINLFANGLFRIFEIIESIFDSKESNLNLKTKTYHVSLTNFLSAIATHVAAMFPHSRLM